MADDDSDKPSPLAPGGGSPLAPSADPAFGDRVKAVKAALDSIPESTKENIRSVHEALGKPRPPPPAPSVEDALSNSDLSRFGYRTVDWDESIRGDLERAHDQHSRAADAPPPDNASPPPSPKAGDHEHHPATKTLDYLALGIILAPAPEVIAMYLRHEDIDWKRVAISFVVSTVIGSAILWFAHGWHKTAGWLAAFRGRINRADDYFVVRAAIIAFFMIVPVFIAPFVSGASVQPSPIQPGFTQQQVNEKIAGAVANLNSQLTEANRQKETAIRDAETLRKQIQNVPPPPRPNYDEPRVYTTKTIAELRGFYKDRTALQGAAFMADEIGKWIIAEGSIQFIRPDGLVFLSDGAGIISCEFDASWKPKLSAFRPGEIMKVAGKIGDGQIGVSPIYLRPCEVRN